MRTGAELLHATKPYAVEDRARSWRLLITTLLVILGSLTMVIAAEHWWAKLLFSVLAGLTQIRLFIFYHDYLHGAILRRSKTADAMMSVIGFWMLSVRSVWRETHNYHHKNNAKMIGSTIGSFPMLTLGMWRGLSAGDRLKYRMARHPLTIFFGYIPVFLIGFALSPFMRDGKKHWGGPVALVVHFVGFATAIYYLGWLTAILFLIVPTSLTMGLGTFLFYAQHNFPDIKLRGRREWDYTFAALRSSSMFDMPRLMHWFTGNIGYHHIHHLNHRIPFYRLPDAMAAVEELQSPGRTSFRWRDVRACLDLAVWNPEKDRMLTYSELRAEEDRLVHAS